MQKIVNQPAFTTVDDSKIPVIDLIHQKHL